MSFELETARGSREFSLPVRVDKVKLTMTRQGVLRRRDPAAHAASVAWRTMLEWLKVQLALIETQQAEAAEIFLPYLLLPAENGKARTLYETYSLERAL